jgi:hypothetical protein
LCESESAGENKKEKNRFFKVVGKRSDFLGVGMAENVQTESDLFLRCEQLLPALLWEARGIHA